MVTKTLKIIELEIPIKKSAIGKVKKRLTNEFGDMIKISVKGDTLRITGEAISNYKVHDRILELTERV